MSTLKGFDSALMTVEEVRETLEALGRPYRLIIDSAGQYGLYIQIPKGARPGDWIDRFWAEHSRLKAVRLESANRWEGVPRPFDPEGVQFLTPGEIADDLYLEALFSAKRQEPERLPAPHLPHWLGEASPPKAGKARRIVFYSYKGGVGRTTALVLTAILLARQGHRVAVVDFDLEAPGVASFLLEEHRLPQKGVVDYLIERPALARLAMPVRIGRLNDEYLGEPELDLGSGSISVLTAGRVDRFYPEKLAYASLEDIERSSENPLDQLFEHLEEALPKLDYILIDSRTGIADIGGSMLFKYADAVCAFFYSNQQNREGLSLLARYLKERRRGSCPEVFWIHSMAPRRRLDLDQDDDQRAHEVLQDHLRKTMEELEVTPIPTLLRIDSMDELRRLSWETLDRKRPFENRETIGDFAALAEALSDWGVKRRRANRKT